MRTRLMLFGTLLALSTANAATSAERAALERFTAFAVNMSNLPTPQRTATVDIVIERWSSKAERDRLIDALLDRGPKGLLDEVRKIKVRAGFIRTATSRGYDLQYARENPGEEGGRRIIIATDREISFLEQRQQPRSIDYPFMLIELRLDKNDEGEGKLALAAKITGSRDKRQIEIENYANEPVRLTQVKKVR